jgi:predicted nucleic acid-binding protein
MKFLLDTNVVSELSNLRPDPKVEAWLVNAAENELACQGKETRHLSALA